MKEENDINKIANYINKFISIKIKNAKMKEQGILLQVGEEWVLLKSLFSDYILDGYKLVNKRYIEFIDRGDDEVLVEDVLKAANKWNNDTFDIPLETHQLFFYLCQNRCVFGITMKEENTVYVGKIDRLKNKSFYFKPITSMGIWKDYTHFFRMDYIRVISVDTDYINSLLAYSETLSSKIIMKSIPNSLQSSRQG